MNEQLQPVVSEPIKKNPNNLYEQKVLKIAQVLENMIWIGDSLRDIGECIDVFIKHEIPEADEWGAKIEILEKSIDLWKKKQGLSGLTVNNKYTDYLAILKEA